MVRVEVGGGGTTATSTTSAGGAGGPVYCAPSYQDHHYYPQDHYYAAPPLHQQDHQLCPQHHQICIPEYGPVTVGMVSTGGGAGAGGSGVPVSVPPGHVLQQIVDENGALRHVILSPQGPHLPPPPPPPPHLQHQHPPSSHYGPSNGSGGPQQYYGPAGYGPPPHFHPHGPPLPPPPPPPHHMPQHSPPPPHAPHPYHKDERAQRQYNKLRRKLEQKQTRSDNLGSTSGHSSPGVSPRKEHPNGVRLHGPGSSTGGGTSSEEGSSAATSVHGDDDDSQSLLDYLSTIQTPQVFDITSRSALVQWSAPISEGSPPPINSSEIRYELLLGDKGRFKAIYSGPALSCRVQDLRPGTEYCVCLQAQVEGFTGAASGTAVIKTPPCEPSAPAPPRVVGRARNSLQLRWSAPLDNGAHIQNYVIQFDDGKGGPFIDVGKTRAKNYHMLKLEESTRYRFRLAAVNDVGQGPWSEEVSFWTCGAPPTAPAPPHLIHATCNSLVLRWEKRPTDQEFNLQYEDEFSRHGYLSAYSGPHNEHNCDGLVRYSNYKFRLRANNEEGTSQWSEEVVFKTLPDRPRPPSKPYVKGKIHSHQFRLKWDPPSDKGGAEIENYVVEMRAVGLPFNMVYSGLDTEITCDRLQPGTAYEIRVNCRTSGGLSDWSEIQTITTECVPPGVCKQLNLVAPPQAYMFNVGWLPPDYNGGSAVVEYTVEVIDDGTTRTAYKGPNTQCPVLEISPGKQYEVRVKASNKAGWGAWSEVLNVTSGAAPPSRPDPPSITIKSPFHVALQWTEPSSNGAPVADYRLEMFFVDKDHFQPVYQGPHLNFDMKNLQPYSQYAFKLSCSNSAGASDYSDLVEVTTPPAAPSAPITLTGEATAVNALIAWQEAIPNGSPILYYKIDIGERQMVTDGPLLEYFLDNLLPETTYRVRVQAVNGIGTGNFSPTLKLSTPPLPPDPPGLQCVQQGHNFLKLKWGDGKNIEQIEYLVEMQSPRRREYHCVYQGTTYTCRVKKLQESTKYKFRICAISDAGGQGDYSAEYEFETTPAPPGPVKGLRCSDITPNSVLIEWGVPKQSLEPNTLFIVQYCRTKDLDYKQVYKGSDTSVTIDNLEGGCDYSVRICGEREVSGLVLQGSWSPTVTWTTLPPVQNATPTPSTSSTPVSGRRLARRSGHGVSSMSDNHYAMLLLLFFVAVAIFAAIAIERFVDWHKSA